MALSIALLALSLLNSPAIGQTLSTVTAPSGCGTGSTSTLGANIPSISGGPFPSFSANSVPANTPISLPTTGAGAATSLPSLAPTISTILVAASSTISNPASSCSSIPYSGTSVPPNYALDFATGMLERHNYLRQFHGSTSPMTWNTTLAAAAQTEVNTCVFQHTVNNPYGENLAGMDRSGGYTSEELVVATDEWYAEISSYNFSNPGFSSATGHFTQLVWLGSTELGCAWQDCTASLGLYFVACEYSPQGNIANAGYFQANVLPPVASVSSCAMGTTSNPGRKRDVEVDMGEKRRGFYKGRRMAREVAIF